MKRASFGEMACPIARTLDVVGDSWTPLVVRDVYLGISRFDAIQRNLGISRKVLAERLTGLVDRGVLVRKPYQDNPPRHDYRLTAKGEELAMVLLAMRNWGERWEFDGAGSPILLRHEHCGQITTPVAICSGCGEPVGPRDVTPVAAPGAEFGPGTLEVPAALARIHGG